MEKEILEILNAVKRTGETRQQALNRLVASHMRGTTPTPEPDGDQWLTVEAVAARWKLSRATVRRRIDLYRTSGGRAGLGPVVRYGYRSLRIPVQSVRRYEKGGVW